MLLLLLLFAFRDLWKEWGDSNFQIFFSTELPVPPQAAGVVGTFNVLDIYPSEHYGLAANVCWRCAQYFVIASCG